MHTDMDMVVRCVFRYERALQILDEKAKSNPEGKLLRYLPTISNHGLLRMHD